MSKLKKTYKTNNICRCNKKIKILEKKISDTQLALGTIENNLVRNTCFAWHKLKQNSGFKERWSIYMNSKKTKRKKKKKKKKIHTNKAKR